MLWGEVDWMLWRGRRLTYVGVEREDYLTLAGENLLIDESYYVAEFVAYNVPVLGSLVVYRTRACRRY